MQKGRGAIINSTCVEMCLNLWFSRVDSSMQVYIFYITSSVEKQSSVSLPLNRSGRALIKATPSYIQPGNKCHSRLAPAE